MRVAIATTLVPFTRGGAEALARELCRAVRAAGHEAEMVEIAFKHYPVECILDHMLACRLLDLTESNGTPIDRVIGLKFPAYLVHHPHKVLWLLQQHRMAYDLWGHDQGDMHRDPSGSLVREAIHKADEGTMRHAEDVYTISENVAQRLRRYNQLDGTCLYHPPPLADLCHTLPAEPYFFFPSRITPLKRQELVIRALAHCNQDVQVRFAGAPDHPPYLDTLRKLAETLGVASRIAWLGRIDDKEMCESYARCLGVVFVPEDEDYGYVTLEAFLSAKPVITVSDAGGVLEFTRDGETGLVTDPEPEALAEALDSLWSDPGAAKRLGRNAKEYYRSLDISWEYVVERLLS